VYHQEVKNYQKGAYDEPLFELIEKTEYLLLSIRQFKDIFHSQNSLRIAQSLRFVLSQYCECLCLWYNEEELIAEIEAMLYSLDCVIHLETYNKKVEKKKKEEKQLAKRLNFQRYKASILSNKLNEDIVEQIYHNLIQ
jgi:hypothetical protein